LGVIKTKFDDGAANAAQRKAITATNNKMHTSLNLINKIVYTFFFLFDAIIKDYNTFLMYLIIVLFSIILIQVTYIIFLIRLIPKITCYPYFFPKATFSIKKLVI